MHKIHWKWSPSLSNDRCNKSSRTNQVQERLSDNRNGSKREDVDAKWSERQLIAHRGTNPFLDANYVDGISGFGVR